MRFLGLLVFLAIVSSGVAIFRSSSKVGGMTTVDADSGDVIWVPIPRDAGVEDGVLPRKCLFCRGRK